MTTANLLIILGVILAVAIFIIFPKARTLVKGFINIFIEDKAATPDGLRALFAEKIDEAQDAYNQAAQMLRRVTGEHAACQKRIAELKQEIVNAERSTETAVRANRMEDAQLFAEKREDLLSSLQTETTRMQQLDVAKKKSEELYTARERYLKDLKRKSKEEVDKMRTSLQTKQLFEDLDEMSADTHVDKLLQSALERSADLEKEAIGAAQIHNSKTSVKFENAEVRARKDASSAYLDELKAKYGQNK